MSTKIKDVIRALRPEKLAEYASDVIVRQRHDLRTHPKGAQRFIFKVMFAAQLAYYSVMFVGWNRKNIFLSLSILLFVCFLILILILIYFFIILYLFHLDHLINKKRAVIKKALDDAHIH